MPIFEYQCDVCGNQFERFIRPTSGPSTERPYCPTCGSRALQQLLSSFAVNSAERRQLHRDQGRKVAQGGSHGAAPRGDGGGGPPPPRARALTILISYDPSAVFSRCAAWQPPQVLPISTAAVISASKSFALRAVSSASACVIPAWASLTASSTFFSDQKLSGLLEGGLEGCGVLLDGVVVRVGAGAFDGLDVVAQGRVGGAQILHGLLVGVGGFLAGRQGCGAQQASGRRHDSAHLPPPTQA